MMIKMEVGLGAEEPEEPTPEIEEDRYKEGVDEVRRQRNIEIASSMKLEGLDLALIAKITGLTPSDIERLD